MCGITGFIDLTRGRSHDELTGIAEAMTATLIHRGPDDGAVWVDAATGVALGHRRLSIIDLSPAGRQPMVSACGRYVLVYNGEVYNTGDLRPALEARGIVFRGHSDTEVILEACAAWGLIHTLPRLIGMFALVLWDRERRTLTLARDRLGIRPLYWSRQGAVILFASELKALRAAPGWNPRLDSDAAASFLRLDAIPGGRTIYQGVKQLAPGSWLTLDASGQEHQARFWDLREVVTASRRDPLPGDGVEAVDQLDALLRDAVSRRMVADVPVGAFLSGGVDSSTVVALMQASSPRPVHTFTIGFPQRDQDEGAHARAVADHLGTLHTHLTVSEGDLLALVPRLCDWFDEPMADASQIPTHMVAALARPHVTVALSGDGGDELFGGYPRYRVGEALWRWLGPLPRPARLAMIPLLRGVGRLPRVGETAERLSRLLGFRRADDLFRGLLSHWDDPARLIPGSREIDGASWEQELETWLPEFNDRMRLLDTLGYLPDDILTKVDRATMAVNLEVRVPLLDHRVVALAWRMPAPLLHRDGRAKWPLRQVLYRYVPPALVDRPKHGFSVPLATWLRGPLRPWAEALLAEERLKREGLLDPAPIVQAWRELLRGRRDRAAPVWNVLVLQAWRQRWGV